MLKNVFPENSVNYGENLFDNFMTRCLGLDKILLYISTSVEGKVVQDGLKTLK